MHTNERATQVRLLRQLFFSPTGFPEWCLAKNVIPLEREHGAALATSNGTNLSIRLTRMWAESINTVEKLQALLMSSQLYRNPVAYEALSAGFESGHMRQTTYIEPQPLSKTLTTAAEAHFRMELYYCLSRPCFSHQKSQASYDSRMNMWHELIPKVFKASGRRHATFAASRGFRRDRCRRRDRVPGRRVYSKTRGTTDQKSQGNHPRLIA